MLMLAVYSIAQISKKYTRVPGGMVIEMGLVHKQRCLFPDAVYENRANKVLDQNGIRFRSVEQSYSY